MCFKLGEPVTKTEKLFLKKDRLKFYDKVKHLGNYFDTRLNNL